MTKNDYIEKITQNLEHLTKDELKDVATLTNAQFGVRLKVAEKEYWGKEIADLKSQIQQQALLVVPSFVAEWIEYVKGKDNNVTALLTDFDNMPEDVDEWLFLQSNDDNINLILRAWLDGYTVEKPQLFYIELPNVYGLKNKIFVSKVENGTIVEFSNGKNYALKLTEQEIKSIDERYWQFAVPVGDGRRMKYTVGFMNPFSDADFTWRTFDTIEEAQKFIEQQEKLGYETGWK